MMAFSGNAEATSNAGKRTTKKETVRAKEETFPSTMIPL